MEFEIRKAEAHQVETVALLRYLLAEHDHTIDDRLDLSPQRMQTSLEHIQTFIKDTNNHIYFLAYTKSGMPVGFLHASVDESKKGKYGYLGEMYVLKAYRGHRLGEQLVAQHDIWLRNKNIKIAAVKTTAGQRNFQTIKFYRQLGYVEEGEEQGGVILVRKIPHK